MQITVLADDTGQVIGMMVHPPEGPVRPGNPDGVKVVPTGAQQVVTLDAPDELANSEGGIECFEALRRAYRVTDGQLTRHRSSD